MTTGNRLPATGLTFRVTTSGVRLRDEAFPDERETSDVVMRTIRRSAGAGE